MRMVPSNGQTVLTLCIDLVDSDDEEGAKIDPMLGQSGPGAGQ